MSFPPPNHFLSNLSAMASLINMNPNQYQMTPMGGIMQMPMVPGLQVPHMTTGISAPPGVTTISAPPIRKITQDPSPILGVNQLPITSPFIFPPLATTSAGVGAVTGVVSTGTINSSKSSGSSMSHHHHNNSNNLNKHKSSSNGPSITVFVGNITDRASDMMVRQLLSKCGAVINWKRVQGANGKLQAFGFCEYADPESAIRAIRLLHDFEIADKKLVVKADAKTQEKLDNYLKEKSPKGSSSNGEGDPETIAEDKEMIHHLHGILKEHEIELSRDPDPNKAQSRRYDKRTGEPAKPENLADMDMEEEKRSLIHREIDKFRDTYKVDESEKKSEQDRKDSKSNSDSRRRDDQNDDRYSRERSMEVDSSSRRDRQRERTPMSKESRSRNRDRYDRDRNERGDRMSRTDRDRDQEREREREQRERERDLDRRRDEDNSHNERIIDDEELQERRRLERKLRDKEASYQKRLRNWEARELRKLKEYKKYEQKQEAKKEEVKEVQKLKQFLEDYDDDRDDTKYYKGSALARRLREREKEKEEDVRDRRQEKRELEDLRRKLAEEGHPDPESEAQKRLNSSDANKERDKLVKVGEPSGYVNKLKGKKADDENSLSGLSENTSRSEMHVKSFTFTGINKIGHGPKQPANPILISPSGDNSNPGSNGEKRKKFSVQDVFNSNDDDDHTIRNKKRKLPQLTDDNTDSNQSLLSGTNKSASVNIGENGVKTNLSSEEKKKQVKSLIEKIPTTKDDLFKYTIDWTLVDQTLMEKRIRPWVNKKITEYIGEEEQALLDFICGKLQTKTSAQSILDDVAMVLDDEAEVFVVKMWRLLIYEIEAKKIGLEKR